MRYFLLISMMLVSFSARAQGLVQQLDASLSEVTTTVSNMRQQIIADQNQIMQLTQQRDTQQKRADGLQKQLDAANAPKVATDPPKPETQQKN
jgi:peptidoglycan hydrolase CwlO-like protein